MVFSVTCKNFNEDKQCGTHFCQICLLNRYGENVEEAVALDSEWKCPICRGICNCSRCMRKRGCKPTGILSPIAKANGFPSVSAMLRLEDCRSMKELEECASLEKNAVPKEEPDAASSERGREKSILDENHDSVYQSKPSKKTRNGKGSSSKMSSGKIADKDDNSEESKKEYGALKDTIDCDEKKVCKHMRGKSLGVRIIHGKIYDSENGKTCHQCRQKTMTFAVRCMNYKGNEQCPLHFCQICLLERYGENAEELAKEDCPWKCPKCRGVCNCSFCMKLKGCKPTGRLYHTAKANGFHSVLEMLDSDMERLTDPSPKRSAASSEDLDAAPSEKGIRKNDAGYQSKPSKKRRNGKVPSISGQEAKHSVAVENSNKCKKRYSATKDSMDCDEHKVSKKIKRTKSPGVRMIGSRVYDSENGKTCHQCRQKSLVFTVTCKNYNKNKQCALHFCQFCLLNRYGEIASEVAALGCQWKCPKCRGVCNCCRCMKKRGYKPTGVLTPAAKANGFPSVSEMLNLEDCRRIKVLDEASLKMSSASNDVSRSTSEDSDEMKIKLQITEENRDDKRVEHKQLNATNNFSAELIGAKKSDKKYLSQEILRPTIKREAVEDVPNSTENKNKFQLNEEEQIDLPPANQLTKISNIELPAEDIGDALHFLAFCHTFGQALDLRKEQAESLLQEIFSGQTSRKRCDFSADYFHMKLLSMIQRDSERGCSLEAAGRDSWIEALSKYISDNEFMSNELMVDWGLDSYDKQSPSKKLRILTFLCDEALGTSELRNWIDQQNLKFVEEEKKIKIAKKKLQDEMAADILQDTGKQLLMSEQQNLSLKMKAEVIQCLNDKLNEMKKRMQNAVRLDPLFSDRNGRKLWKLSSYSGEMDVLLQDVVADASFNCCKEKWFGYNVQEKASVEKYIAGYYRRNAANSFDILGLDATHNRELRNWIGQQNLTFVEEAKRYQQIKIARKKVQDEMDADILQNTGKQLLMNLVRNADKSSSLLCPISSVKEKLECDILCSIRTDLYLNDHLSKVVLDNCNLFLYF
ncbi:hypothetical protein Leryth_011492 [Lithospermum erythrorhizon]|nr:hypothetical protein Leryth_011492 [Lithospermum erythrorhizon]